MKVIAERWFPPKERFIAILFGVQCVYLGNAFGALFSAYYVTDNGLENDITYLCLIFAIICTVPFILCLFCIKEKPLRPPNYTQVIFILLFSNSGFF